jgi:hypothetical protein
MAEKMRAKMRITKITRFDQSEMLELTAVAKSGAYNADGNDEDNTYAKFSPSGAIQLTVANPALLGKFNPGEAYYIDFTPVAPK